MHRLPLFLFLICMICMHSPPSTGSWAKPASTHTSSPRPWWWRCKRARTHNATHTTSRSEAGCEHDCCDRCTRSGGVGGSRAALRTAATGLVLSLAIKRACNTVAPAISPPPPQPPPAPFAALESHPISALAVLAHLLPFALLANVRRHQRQGANIWGAEYFNAKREERRCGR
jgi:hypothetical protein